MKKLLILIPSILFVLSFTSCQEEEKPLQLDCDCGIITERFFNGQIYLKNKCTNNIMVIIVDRKDLINLKSQHCFGDGRIW
jgi:hypothetical protein